MPTTNYAQHFVCIFFRFVGVKQMRIIVWKDHVSCIAVKSQLCKEHGEKTKQFCRHGISLTSIIR